MARRPLDITREDWDQHVSDDDQRGREINDLKMAMFGDPGAPDTVKQAVMPTMTRLNTYMDYTLMLCKGTVALLVGTGAFLGILKTMGWL
jgi:hypothetical protein